MNNLPGAEIGALRSSASPRRTSRPLISVILPVFNGEPVVSDAIRSILDQTVVDWELLVGDDGSTDRTFAVCQGFASRDPRISVTRSETNLGVARMRNRLVSRARAPFLAFQDADDVSLPERFARELAVFDQHPDVGVVCGMVAWLNDAGEIFSHWPWILEAGRQFPPSRPEMVTYLYVRGNKVPMPTAMVRREVIDGLNPPFDPAALAASDWQFFLRLAHRYRFYGIPEDLARMRRGGGRSSITGDKKRLFFHSRRCLRVILESCGREPDSPINYALYRQAMSHQLLEEARSYGPRGLPTLLRAIAYDPHNREAWQYGREFGRRGVRKILKLAARVRNPGPPGE